MDNHFHCLFDLLQILSSPPATMRWLQQWQGLAKTLRGTSYKVHTSCPVGKWNEILTHKHKLYTSWDLHGLLDVGQKQSDKVHSYACVSLLHVRILSNIWTHACMVTCVTVSSSDTLGPKYNWLYIQDTLVQYFLYCKCLKSSSNFTAPFNRNFVRYVIYYLMHMSQKLLEKIAMIQ